MPKRGKTKAAKCACITHTARISSLSGALLWLPMMSARGFLAWLCLPAPLRGFLALPCGVPALPGALRRQLSLSLRRW